MLASYWPNTVVSLLAMLALSVVVLHPRIREGIWVKGGLTIMILSLFVSAISPFSVSPFMTGYAAGVSLRVGILIACVGMLLRYIDARAHDRPTDFDSLME